MNEVRLELSSVRQKVYLGEFLEQELERTFVFDLTVLVDSYEDFVGRTHDVTVIWNGANFNLSVPGLGGFERCRYMATGKVTLFFLH